MALAMLTTIDNPYDPFTQFDDWYKFDEEAGYHSCAYLDRVAKTYSDEGWEAENAAIEAAIDEIVELNLTGKYKKVTKNMQIK